MTDRSNRTWAHPPHRHPPFLARYGAAILIVAASWFVAAALIIIVEKALGQAAYDAARSEPFKG